MCGFVRSAVSAVDADVSDMSPSVEDVRLNRRLMAYTAAALYAVAGVGGVLERVGPGGPGFPVVPSLFALALAAFLLVAGPRFPTWAMTPLGPLGVALIAYALASSLNAGDTAVLYVLPVLWVAFFFGPRGAIAIVICVGLANGLVPLFLPARSGSFDHWIEVMVAVSAVAATITVLARRDAELARLAGEARTDALTGLLNRRGFEERAAVELAHARREGRPIAVASFDIDYFKRVNDEWGHETGDRVLARVGSVLATHSREVDVVARIGGEEFLALLPAATSAEADAFTQRVRRALATFDPAALPAVGVSAGVAAASAPASVQELLQQADRALYAAKRAGRGHTRIFEYLTPRLTSVTPPGVSVPSSRLAPAIRASRRDAGHAARARSGSSARSDQLRTGGGDIVIHKS